jgi:hypothetical protein
MRQAAREERVPPQHHDSDEYLLGPYGSVLAAIGTVAGILALSVLIMRVF